MPFLGFRLAEMDRQESIRVLQSLVCAQKDLRTMLSIDCQLDLNDSDAAQLAQILGCERDGLEQSLAPYAAAAMQEYTSLFLGQKVFRRGSDQQEYRLFLLIRQVFENKLPDDRQVSRLFQTTATESRALVRSVRSKYQYQLRNAVESSLQVVCRAARAEKTGGEFYAVINSGNTVDELNRLLAEIDGNLPRIQKRRGSVSTYELKPSAYSALCSHLKVKPNEYEANE